MRSVFHNHILYFKGNCVLIIGLDAHGLTMLVGKWIFVPNSDQSDQPRMTLIAPNFSYIAHKNKTIYLPMHKCVDPTIFGSILILRTSKPEFQAFLLKCHRLMQPVTINFSLMHLALKDVMRSLELNCCCCVGKLELKLGHCIVANSLKISVRWLGPCSYCKLRCFSTSFAEACLISLTSVVND